ncbi:MFS transporter [Cutibacterium equinum]|uniref:MFS transporter n=1 Tax=Cutibacterium equinum TaxID=3016342 RepID=A0ABY7R2Q8_9ACTN|nr:MFS transporter [Cutibacterium equinum]WCC81162.1 MFS transporter [Cutibacterium equinum]
MTWVVWITAVIAYGCAVMQRTSLGVMGLTAADHFNAPASVVATFMVLQLAVYAVLQVPAGVAVDRWGSRVVITAGSALMALGQVSMALAGSVGGAMMARILVGCGDAFIFGSAVRLVPAWFPSRQIPLMTQLTGLLGQFGQVVSAVGLVRMVNSQGWRLTYLVAAAVAVAATVLAVLLIRDFPPGVEPERTDANFKQLPRQVAEVVRHPSTRLAFWAHMSSNFAGIVFSLMWGMPYLTHAEGRSTATASTLMTVYVVANAVSGPLAGILTSRHPIRRGTLIEGMIGMSALAWLVVLVWPGHAPLWLLYVLVICLGVSLPGGGVGFDVARTFQPGNRLATATGVAITGGFLCGLLEIEIIGLLLDVLCPGGHYTLGGFRWAMATQLVFFAIGLTGLQVNQRRLYRIMIDQGVTVPTWREALARQWRVVRQRRR